MIILWRLTTLCNLACRFCAYDRTVPQPRVHMPAVEVQRVAGLFADYHQRTGYPVLLSWLGGEPLLWPGLLPLSQRLRQQGLRISMTSNGTRAWQDGAAPALAEAFDEITFSIDAPGALHDALRGWPGGARKLERAIRALARQRGARAAPRLRANVVLMHATVEHFPALCLQLAEWGVDEITFNQLGGRDRPLFHRQQALTVADVAQLRLQLPALVQRLAGRGVRLHAHDAYLDRFQASARGIALPMAECEARRPTLFIDEQGRIGACSFTVDTHAIASSDLRQVEDIGTLRERLRQQRRERPATVCNDCPSTQVFAKFGT